jgi:chromosome segregation protein
MTKILRMEMKGFKSFANKTEIVFGDKFNCVLGPNGSGKSNILDALCFVLGKGGSKGLRVEKSSNLIYNGGKSKQPAKEGEVSIWFDNSKKEFEAYDEKEIKLTRIIRVTGQGIYKINDKTMTRTQIVDLMAMVNIDPDGYNIILQGDIIRLIEMSTVDRRKIVEEVAGINVYEDKKEKALRELTRVEEKINSADIILVEREAYLKELKKDRDQAMKYKELEDRKKRNKKTLLTNDANKKESQLKDIDEKIKLGKSKIENYQKQIEELKVKIDDRKKQIEDINKEVESKGEKEQVAVHKEVETLKVGLGIDKQRLDTIAAEIEKLTSRQQDLKKDFSELKTKIDLLDKKKIEVTKQIQMRNGDLKTIETKISEFRKKHNLQEESKTDDKLNTIDTQIEEIQTQMNSLREKQQTLLRDKDKLDMQLQSIDERLNKVAEVKKEHKEEIEKLNQKKKEFKTLAMDLSKALSESSEYALQLSNARSKLILKREDYAKANAKKIGMLEQISGNSALQSIMEMRKSDPKIYGTVAELASSKNEFSLALEIAAGNKVKSVVVEDDITAAKCIKFVKDKRLGVITVLPLNKLKDIEISDSLRKLKKPGVHGLAIDLIKYDSKFSKVFKYVFASTLIVDSIDVARQIGVGTARMATLTGDLTELSGAMQGGYREKKTSSGIFNQEEINTKINECEKEIGDLESVISLLEKKDFDNNDKINRFRTLKAELEGDIIRTEKSLHLDADESELSGNEKKLLKDKLKSIDKEVDDVQDEISTKNNSLAKLKIEKQTLKDKIMELRNPTKLAELQSFEDKKSELKGELLDLESQKKHATTEMETIIGPENKKIMEIIKQHDKEMDGFIKEQSDLRKKISSDEKELKEKEKLEVKFIAQFKELFNKRDKLNTEKNGFENKIVNHNGDIRLDEQRINAYSLESARLISELAGLNEELKYYKEVEVYTGKSDEQMKRELSQFEKLASEIGAVNMRALEIYDTVEKEYHKLMNKKETLSVERTEVLSMINEIDSKKKDLFLKTFYQLDEHFKKFFGKLLVKGDASLVLENEADPFAEGLEIKVRLTGKRFLDIRSLSGGEKTLTALAFLFAVQEYQPASFYVLDEVDAALDKKNSEKLGQLIRSYCAKAQYIVISHTDGIIAEADILYGTSMNEHGMTKITTLKI